MKSFLSILIFFALFIDVNAADTKLKKYENYSDEITWKGIDIKLPKGEWMYFSRETDSLQNFNLGCVRFLNIRNMRIDGSFSACYITSGGKWRQALGIELKNEWQNNKYDSCNLRQNIFTLKLYLKERVQIVL